MDSSLVMLEPARGAGEDRIAVFKYLRASRRRLKPMLLTASVVLAAAVAAALFWPAKYQSAGTILIEQQEVPEDFVRSAVSSYADQRVQVIGQRVMTSANLLGIIHKFSVYADDGGRSTREALIERLKKDIQVDMISADVVDPRLGRATKATIAFSVGFTSPSPTQASGVANELVSLYLSENVQSRQQLAEGTASFLAEEAKKLGSNIADLEHKVATFKEANSQMLPEFSQVNVTLLNRQEDELRDVETRMRQAEQQAAYLESQMAQVTPSSLYMSEGGQRILSPGDRLKIARTEYASAAAIYSPTHPTVRRLQREIEGLEREVKGPDSANDMQRALIEAQGELASARERYAPDHPDVQLLQRRVAGLQAEVKRMDAKQSHASTASGSSDQGSASARANADNPAFLQLQAQREAAVNEHASLQVERDQIKTKLEELEERLARAPGVERDYNALLRDLQSEQAKYSEVRQKQLQAQLSANMEMERKGERFTLIEPPITPQKPVSPNRRALLALGVIVALCAAIGMMLLLEALDTRIRGRDGVISLVRVPPLAVIGWVPSPEDRIFRRRRLLLASAAVVAFVTIAAVAAFALKMPVDMVWNTLSALAAGKGIS